MLKERKKIWTQIVFTDYMSIKAIVKNSLE